MVRVFVKICYIAIDVAIPFFRGASTHVFEVARHLTKLGHVVHVVSRRAKMGQKQYEILSGVHIHRIYRGIVAPLPFSSYDRLEKGGIDSSAGPIDHAYAKYLFIAYAVYAGSISSQIIRRHGLDVILERETSFGAGAVANMVTGKPMILELIGPRYSRASIRRAKKVLAYTRNAIPYHLPSGKVVFVDAAVDPDVFKPDPVQRKLIRERYHFGDSPVVGYVGTFAKWHGVEELIHGSMKLLTQYPQVRFLMVGPYFTWAKELAEKLKISEAYTFTGPIPHQEVPNYINASDIMVAPYNPQKSELRKKYGIGSPLKLFEYMACSRPVISTSMPPITRVIRERETGLLIPEGNSEALNEAIACLIEKPSLAEKIGKAARKEVQKSFSWATFAANLSRIFYEVTEIA